MFVWAREGADFKRGIEERAYTRTIADNGTYDMIVLEARKHVKYVWRGSRFDRTRNV